MEKILLLSISLFAPLSAMHTIHNQFLITAATVGNLQLAQKAINEGADVDSLSYGSTALHLASSFARLEIMKLLIDAGATVNAQDLKGKTPLMKACAEGHTDAVRLLIASHADVNAKNSNRETALMMACNAGQREIATLLVAAGADVNAKDTLGLTPLFFASREGHTQIAKFLIESGAEINASQGVFSWTPLMWAAIRGHTEVLKLLIVSGAQVSALNFEMLNSESDHWVGKAATVKRKCNPECIKLIRDLVDFLDNPVQSINASADYWNQVNSWSLAGLYRTYLSRQTPPCKNHIHLIWATVYKKDTAYDYLVEKYPHVFIDPQLIAQCFLIAARVGNEHVLRHLRYKLRDLRTKNFTPVLLKAVAYIHQLHPELTDLAQQILAEDIPLKIRA